MNKFRFSIRNKSAIRIYDKIYVFLSYSNYLQSLKLFHYPTINITLYAVEYIVLCKFTNWHTIYIQNIHTQSTHKSHNFNTPTNTAALTIPLMISKTAPVVARIVSSIWYNEVVNRNREYAYQHTSGDHIVDLSSVDQGQSAWDAAE